MNAVKTFGKFCVMAAVGLTLALSVSACGRKGPVEPPAYTNTK